MILWGENEEATVSVPVVVSVDRASVRVALLKLFPKNSKIDVRTSNDVLIITGTMERAEEVDALHKFMEAAKLKYVDMTTMAGVPQVQIKVMLAETNRTAIRSLGINMFQNGKSFIGGQQIGPDVGGAR